MKPPLGLPRQIRDDVYIATGGQPMKLVMVGELGLRHRDTPIPTLEAALALAIDKGWMIGKIASMPCQVWSVPSSMAISLHLQRRGKGRGSRRALRATVMNTVRYPRLGSSHRHSDFQAEGLVYAIRFHREPSRLVWQKRFTNFRC